MTLKPFDFLHLISLFKDQWDQIESLNCSLPLKGLLRLQVLRHIDHAIHTQRSFLLATGTKKSADWMSIAQTKLNILRETNPNSHLDLSLLLTQEGVTYPKRHSVIPETLHTIIGKEEFDRFDRAWEHALCQQGLSPAGCNLWELSAQLRPQDAQNFQHLLEANLFPHGIVLFSRSQGMAEDKAGLLWEGSWLILLEPRFKTPRFEKSGETLLAKPAIWKLLFQSKGTHS